MSLSVNDFAAFHQAVHGGCSPFNWQSQLLRQVVEERRWPRVLDLPTGSGKTTCIDIALFALALDVASAPDKRWCPRRIAMVVDRRVIVDQAAERGRKLLAALTASTDAAVVKVREALASLSKENEPLGVFALRGGIPKDDGWARTPDQALVIASTVDQLGSRLLIQGYGVSLEMRPVHAGLAGNDILILLDEVHLSKSFKQTLERLGSLRERFAGNGLPRRFQFVFLSATPGEAEANRFPSTSELLESDPNLRPRLDAKKPVRLIDVAGREELTERVASEAKKLLERHRVVAAIVNRVDTALAVFASLKTAFPEGEHVVLFTGRMRPLDRDDVLAVYRRRILADVRKRTADEPKLVVVGTQCIEAGADFDFDAMVTESASFDGLRQRFGRVDRLGEYQDDKGNHMAEGVIVHDKDVKDDPIYRETITETVKWLKTNIHKKRKTIDFGSRSLLDAPADTLAPKESAPAILPAYLDLWSQTAPSPAAIPQPALFLHGPRSGPADVQVIWRADLDKAKFRGSRPNVVATVGAVRPSSLEAMSLPYVSAYRWLGTSRAKALEGSGDVEIRSDDDAAQPRAGGRRALRWSGDKSEIVGATKVRPGDTLIVPSAYGGIDPVSKCFDPNAEEEVPDLAERASLMSRGRPLLRLHPGVLAGLGLDLDLEDPQLARDELAALAGNMSGWKRPWARWLAQGRKTRTVPWGDAGGDGWVILSGDRVTAREVRSALAADVRVQASIEDGVESTTDDEDSPYVGSEVDLGDHIRRVEEYVRDYATRLGFPRDFVNDLSLAAWLHDIGKADVRFQRMLRGGSDIAYYRDEGRILAKSGMAADSRAEHRRAQRRSGYPRGARHEVQSIAMIETARQEIAKGAHDLDLVMHLVASHHGHCRPFAPAIDDPQPVDVTLAKHNCGTFGTLTFTPTTSANGLHRLDSALADRFWSLVVKYGWLELCWLETILRLADHRASEDEARG